LLALIASLFTGYRFVLRQDARCNAAVFGLACAWGGVAQALLGPRLNLYTPNITVYVSFVSVAAILTWGVGLSSVYAAHLLLARAMRSVPRFWHFLAVGVPVLIAVEWTGSNVIRMKLYDHASYPALLPPLNAMNAPAWIYAFYLAAGVLFYPGLKAVGLSEGCWAKRVRRRGRGRGDRRTRPDPRAEPV